MSLELFHKHNFLSLFCPIFNFSILKDWKFPLNLNNLWILIITSLEGYYQIFLKISLHYSIVLQNIDLVKIHDGWYGKTITNPCAKTPLQSKLFKPIYVQLNCLFWSNGYLWPGKNCIAPLHCIGCNCVRVSDNDKKCPLPRKVCQQIKVPLGPQIPAGQSSNMNSQISS